jgi:trehalose/maltose hydrolase-like predicted phosphorylase
LLFINADFVSQDSEKVVVGVIASQVPSAIKVNASGGLIRHLTVIKTSLDSKDPLGSARDEFVRLEKRSGQINESVLYDEHVKEWEKVWESGIEITGNLFLAQCVNSR